jgi:nucleoside-diphosphate-sugar epimerase
MHSTDKTILVTGASSMIGVFLLPRLADCGFRIRAISRRHPGGVSDPDAMVYWHNPDEIRADTGWLSGIHAVIHLAPLVTLPPLIPVLAGAGVKRLIAFGSTSVFSKRLSPDVREAGLSRALETAEAETARLAETSGMAWTIFRPTLIYAPGLDSNVTTIARFIARFGFFPLVGQGTGRRQPVHAEDLAHACLSALDNPLTYGKAYNLSGGETLSYRDMVIRLFGYLERPVRLVTVPLSLLRGGLTLLSGLPGYRYLTPEMANRMNRDLCFEAVGARQDFGFAPRRFLEKKADHTGDSPA